MCEKPGSVFVYEFPILFDFNAVLRHAAEAEGSCLEELGVRVPEASAAEQEP